MLVSAGWLSVALLFDSKPEDSCIGEFLVERSSFAGVSDLNGAFVEDVSVL